MAEPVNLVARRAAALVEEALADTRVVLIQGARQVGKSTLASRLVRLEGAELRTLDDAAVLAAAVADPVGFVDADHPLIIDEVQRAPGLLLAIKARVDSDPRVGQFLLTGSSQVLALRGVADAMPGRVETVELWPLSQGELDNSPDGFIDAVFERGPDLRHRSAETRASYADRLAAGGHPGARHRVGRRRSAYFDNYLRSLVDRDVRDLADIERLPQLRSLLPLVAARSSSELNATTLADQLGVSRQTVARYLVLLESVFLTSTIPAWGRSVSRRATGQAKVVFVDSGIATHLAGHDAASLTGPVSGLGPLLEGFVAMELARQATWSGTRIVMSHYRTRDGVEVDLVLGDPRGRVVGIEVKAASTVGESDFRGLRHLRARIGSDFVAGVVLYTGQHTLSFGDRLIAAPVATVWEAGTG